MKKIFATVQNGHLVPVSAYDASLIAELKPGKVYDIEVKSGRSTKQLRFWRALLSKVWQATGRGANPDALGDMIKQQLGYVEPREDWAGRIQFVPRSTAFSEMDGQEFNEFLNAAIDFIFATVLDGVPRGPLLDEIHKMTETRDGMDGS